MKSRRWCQFSVRTLLLIVTLIGCGLGWLSMRIREARSREAAVAEIRGLGGYIVYEDELDAQGNYLPCAAPELSGPAWLNALLGSEHFRNVNAIFLSGKPLNDDNLRQLATLTELRILWLDGTEISDAGLAHLGSLQRLAGLRLSESRISDAGLDQLRGLAQLKWLAVQHTQVTTAGVAKLQASLPECVIDR